MPRPPRLARLLIRLFASVERNEAYLGDIEEMYAERISAEGVRPSRLWYWKETLGSLPAHFRDILYWSCCMFKNYLKTAFRALRRHKALNLEMELTRFFIEANVTGVVIRISVRTVLEALLRSCILGCELEPRC